MNLLGSIIPQLKKEEIRHFKLFASRSHAQQARKDLHLFDYIKKQGADYNENEIAAELYGDNGKNPFYRLKNRLLDEINRSLWLQHFQEDEFSNDLYLFSVAKLHFRYGRIEVAQHYLKRAAREAINHENFEILDLIYGLFIQLSYAQPSINPETYILLRKENRQKLEALNSIDDLLAAITYRIKVSSNHNIKDQHILSLLQATVDEYASDPLLLKSPKVRIKIYDAVSKLLLQRDQFDALEAYLLETYQSFSEQKLFTKQTHAIKLQMLTYLVNTFYHNGKYKDSLEWAKKLKEAMEAFDGMFHDTYLFLYYNALALNYAIVDEQKAIELLLKLKKDAALRAKSFNLIFIYINIAGLHHNRNEFKKALRSLIDLSLLDDYANADHGLRLKVAIFELIIRYQMEEEETFTQRLGQIKKDYYYLLSTAPHALDRAFLKLLQKLHLSLFQVDTKVLIAAELYTYQKLAARIKQDGNQIFDYNHFVEQQAKRLGIEPQKVAA